MKRIQKQRIFAKFCQKMRKSLTKIFWNIEVWAVQKHVNLVDLVKSFPTNIYLQNLASTQKRTSPVKFDHLAEKSEKGSISNLSTKVRAAVTAEGRIRWASVAGDAAADTPKLSSWRFFGVLTKSLRSSPDFLRTLGNHVSGPFEITMRKSRTFEN